MTTRLFPSLRSTAHQLLKRIGLNVIRARAPQPGLDCFCPRFRYQSRFVHFKVSEGDRAIDISSGADPFPHAGILTERFLEPTHHRHSQFQGRGKPVVISDIHNLPFRAGSFDYVYCCHVLEHVDDPICACTEIMRVGKRGYLETPTLMRDQLFSWAKGMHRWHITVIGNRLAFFEYSPRKLEGIRSTWWRDMFNPATYSRAQEVMWDNMDIFVNMFEWEQGFDVDVFYLDGRTRHFAAPVSP